MADPRITVALLSYDRPHFLRQSLPALLGQTARDVEVLVVDNRSARSPEVARVVAEHPRARLIANPTNLGYAAAMNLAVRQARGTWVHLTEDDMILAPDCVERLVSHLEAHPELGAASGLIAREGTDRIHFAGGRIELGARFRLELLGQGAPLAPWPQEPYAVDYLTGAMLCARRELLACTGPFRSEFFLYMEDVELCLRLRRAGHGLAVVPAARATTVHWYPEGLRPRPGWLELHKRKNTLATYALHATRSSLLRYLLRTGLIDPVLCAVAARDPRPAWVGGRALAWFLPRLPAYLREREPTP